MKVKKFMAPTMPEVMKKIRKDLGADAVILNSKVVHQGGVLGFFKKKNIEVIAAIDPQPQPKKQNKMEFSSTKEPIDTPKLKASSSTDDILKEVKDIKKWIEGNSNLQIPNFPSDYQLLFQQLVANGVESELAKEIIQETIEMEADTESSVEKARSLLIDNLKRRMANMAFDGIQYDHKYVHLVGPTGVGKTTTIAKIAANSVLKDNKKVAFITTDTYRIAAIDQLKTYSKILNVPLEIAYSLEDYHLAREKFKDYDLVLIDTAGRNFRDPKYVKELEGYVNLHKDMAIYLVLALTTKSADMEGIYNQFNNVPIKQFIFTKEDETSTYGAILNLCLKSDLGVAYITNGQDVPDDITGSSVEKICDMIVGEQADE